ncbi:MAG: hypothetical protein QRY74_05130 [Chlamydia sp.]
MIGYYFLISMLFFTPISLVGKDLLPKFSMPNSQIDSMSDEERLLLLITTTEETLTILRKIESAIAEFRKQEKLCIQQKRKDSLFELSRRACIAYDLIQEREFEPYFRKEFINELELLAQVYKNRSIPSPKIS